MNQDLIKKLNNFKQIEPDAAFLEKCRGRILALSSKPEKRFVLSWPVFALSGTFVAIVLIGVLSLAFIFPEQRVSSASFDSQKLNQEFDNLSINIQLKEVKYHQDVNQTIASALSEISGTKTKHLNSSILEKEKNDLEINQNQNGEIDEMLKSIVL